MGQGDDGSGKDRWEAEGVARTVAVAFFACAPTMTAAIEGRKGGDYGRARATSGAGKGAMRVTATVEEEETMAGAGREEEDGGESLRRRRRAVRCEEIRREDRARCLEHTRGRPNLTLGADRTVKSVEDLSGISTNTRPFLQKKRAQNLGSSGASMRFQKLHGVFGKLAAWMLPRLAASFTY